VADTPGILAIFNNVARGREAAFETWMQHEHLAERLAVPGFLLARRYEALAGTPRFFISYLTRSATVLTSPAYLARLDDPTPQTRMIMTEVFRDMCRTVCHRAARLGAGRGSVAIAARFAVRQDVPALRARIEAALQDPAVACGEVWTAANTSEFRVSQEERLRGGDQRIGACLLIETLRVDSAERIAATLAGEFPQAEIGVYRLLCERGA